MAIKCMKCNEIWNVYSMHDYKCPCCGKRSDQQTDESPTLEHLYEMEFHGEADVIRLTTGQSVYDEADNYYNQY